MLLVIKIFLCVENLIRKEHEVVFLEEEIFQSGNELLWKKKKKKEKKLVSNNSPLASFAVSTRAKISGIHLERDRFPSFSILRVI